MSWLFDSSIFMTRSHCGYWENWLMIINQVANFLIFLAYMTIPLSLFSMWRIIQHRPELRQCIKRELWILPMFVFFILSCGFTHLMDVLSFSWSPYRLFTLIDCVTAIASVPTAILLPYVLKKLLRNNNEE